jgi:hypothetical protein
MGSFIEINDTLQISKEQGFPESLDYESHKIKNFRSSDFDGKIFEFKNKPSIRLYQAPPVRNFLVENIDGKWLYWAQIHILEIKHDYVNKTTSGKFKIIHINSVEEMKQAHLILDRTKSTDFFNLM